MQQSATPLPASICRTPGPDTCRSRRRDIPWALRLLPCRSASPGLSPAKVLFNRARSSRKRRSCSFKLRSAFNRWSAQCRVSAQRSTDVAPSPCQHDQITSTISTGQSAISSPDPRSLLLAPLASPAAAIATSLDESELASSVTFETTAADNNARQGKGGGEAEDADASSVASDDEVSTVFKDMFGSDSDDIQPVGDAAEVEEQDAGEQLSGQDAAAAASVEDGGSDVSREEEEEEVELSAPMASSNWPEALRWMLRNLPCFLDLHSRFRPHTTASRLFGATATLWQTCLVSLLDFIDKHDPSSSAYQTLVLLFEHLPALLLPVPGNVNGKAKDCIIRKQCKLFLRGEWSKLFKRYAPPEIKAGKVVNQSKSQVAHPQQGPLAPVSLTTASERRKQLATRQFAEGDLHRAVRTLLSSGIYKAASFEALVVEAQAKFPSGEAPVFHSSSADELTSAALGELEWDWLDILDTTGLINAVKRYSTFAGADDQGWKIKQHLSPLVSHPIGVRLYCKHILQGVLLGRMPDLLMPVLSANRRGGRFIPLSKGEKPGLRPIVIGSAHRRLATKLTLASIRPLLDQHFLSSHPRAVQFGLDRDGCLKFSQAASALLPLNATGDEESLTNPTVLVSLDAKNAFNCLSRQALFDSLEGKASRAYFEGAISQGGQLVSCPSLRLFSSYLASYYGDAAKLRLLSSKDKATTIDCSSGVFQGDVPSSVLYCHALHPLLIHVADSFPSVHVLAYADNVVIIGPLEEAVAATSMMKKYMGSDLKLEVQPRESQVFLPSWHGHPSLSGMKKRLQRRLKQQLLHFEITTEGVLLGGLPVGNERYHLKQMRLKVTALNAELPQLAVVDHGFMFKTIVRASHLQKLRFFLQGSSPFLPQVQAQIQRFDLGVHLALEKYHCWPSLNPAWSSQHSELLQFARYKRELPHSRGGDEFTPSEGLHPAVYYSSISRFLAWFSDQPMSRARPSPNSLDAHCPQSLRAQKHPLAVRFVEVHDYIHNAGAVLYRRVVAALPSAAQQQPADGGGGQPQADLAADDGDGRSAASPVQIPCLLALVNSSHQHFIAPPAQRELTPLVMRIFPRHLEARAALTDQQRDVLSLHSRKRYPLKSKDRALQSTVFASFPENKVISHAPMRVSSFYPLKAFPKRLAMMLDCYLHGMPFQGCPTTCDGCKRDLGDSTVTCHHLQTCKRRAAKLSLAHDNLTRVMKSFLNEAGFSCTIDTVGDPKSRRQIPTHLHGKKSKGDIHIPGIRDLVGASFDSLMADVTLVHPYVGSSANLTTWGEVHLDALDVAAASKIRNHRGPYAMHDPPRAFLPLAISTDGGVHEDALRFLWYLADVIGQRSLADEPIGHGTSPEDGPAGDVLARKRASTFQRLCMQLSLEALLSGARRMTPLGSQAFVVEEAAEDISAPVSPRGQDSSSSGAASPVALQARPGRSTQAAGRHRAAGSRRGPSIISGLLRASQGAAGGGKVAAISPPAACAGGSAGGVLDESEDSSSAKSDMSGFGRAWSP